MKKVYISPDVEIEMFRIEVRCDDSGFNPDTGFTNPNNSNGQSTQSYLREF